MSTKTVLIVLGSAAGVFVLLKMLQPSPAAAAVKPRAPTDTISLNSIIGLGSALAGFFKSDSTPNDGTYHADTSGFSISGNTLVDSGGNELVYGTGY